MSYRRNLAAALVGLCLSFVARAEIPGTGNPNVYTSHEYCQQKNEYNHLTLVYTYKQVGHHNPKWDDLAIKFLDAMALRLSNGLVLNSSALPGMLDLPACEKLGKAALDAGCDDPQLVDMYCAVLSDMGRRREMKALVRQAADQMLVSHYPVFRAGSCIRRAIRNVDPNAEPQVFSKYDQDLYDSDLATLKLGDYPGIERRMLLDFFEEDFRRWPVTRQGKFVQEAIDAKGDAWLTDMVAGRYHINAAWQARGMGPGSTVTARGDAQMMDELGKAAVVYQDAYKLQPKYPEAAAQMVTVCMGGDPKNMRKWFDASVAAQFDYAQAYENYLYALLPRWYGSHTVMYQFGLECAATKRYDTTVPSYLIDALHRIQSEGETTEFWKTPGLVDAAADVLSHYGDVQKEPKQRSFYYSEIVGYASKSGQFNIGRSALDKIGGQIDSPGVVASGMLPDRAASETYAMTGPSAAKLNEGEQSAASGTYDAAIEKYLAVKQETKPGDPSMRWIDGRMQELTWLRSFDKGEVVELTPSADLTGWYPTNGQFESDGKTLQGTTVSNGAAILCGAQFGDRFELSARVEVLPSADGSAPADAAHAGLIFFWMSPTTSCTQLINPVIAEAGIEIPGLPFQKRKGDPGGQTLKLRAEIYDGYIKATIDDHPYIPWYNWSGAGYGPDSHIGLACGASVPGLKFKISEVQIKKLTQEPSHS